MYKKKIVFSLVSVPALVFTHQLREYQTRHREDKTHEIERRSKALAQKPIDITPKNGASFLWAGEDAAAFEQKMSMKPVAVRGIYDHGKEIRVEKMRNGEKGYDMVTPFYTHLDASGKAAGILVNRGWVPYDLRDTRQHQQSVAGTIYGVLYQGDAQFKWSKPNSPTIEAYHTVKPQDFALIDQLPNGEAS
jgi:cytochrome oxidase assembly protein ShyY1